MNRVLAVVVAAALALPVAALAWMVVDAERMISGMPVVRVAITGYDPRDPLRGHYLRYRFDWGVPSGTAEVGTVGELCVRSAPRDGVAVVVPVQPRKPVAKGDCVVTISGRGTVLAEARRTTPDQPTSSGRVDFTPYGVEDLRLYVPEEHAKALERALLDGKTKMTVDLAVRPDGRSRVKAWHIDGRTIAEWARERR